MDVSWLALLRAVHVTAASAWFGAVVFSTLFLGPTLRAAGDDARGFIAAVNRRGGIGRFAGPLALVTLASGILLYGILGIFRAPFGSVPAAMLTVGALLALGGWTYGALGSAPLQRRLAGLSASPPSPGRDEEMRQLQVTLASRGRVFAAAVSLAFLLMVGRHVVSW